MVDRDELCSPRSEPVEEEEEGLKTAKGGRVSPREVDDNIFEAIPWRLGGGNPSRRLRSASLPILSDVLLLRC